MIKITMNDKIPVTILVAGGWWLLWKPEATTVN
jgi:hypothetical protein